VVQKTNKVQNILWVLSKLLLTAAITSIVLCWIFINLVYKKIKNEVVIYEKVLEELEHS
jgi:hypothetical protein